MTHPQTMLASRIDDDARTLRARGSLRIIGLIVTIAGAADPIADISVMKRVSFVMKDGIVYKLNSTPVALAP